MHLVGYLLLENAILLGKGRSSTFRTNRFIHGSFLQNITCRQINNHLCVLQNINIKTPSASLASVVLRNDPMQKRKTTKSWFVAGTLYPSGLHCVVCFLMAQFKRVSQNMRKVTLLNFMVISEIFHIEQRSTL